MRSREVQHSLFDAFRLFLNYVRYIHVSIWSYGPNHVDALLNTMKLLSSTVKCVLILIYQIKTG